MGARRSPISPVYGWVLSLVSEGGLKVRIFYFLQLNINLKGVLSGCMAGAGSNMLRVHAYVKLLAVTTWIIAIWPFLSSWSGSFILWFNIGFEIPRPTLTSTLLQLVVTGTAWVVRSEVVLAVAHSTVLVLLSGIGAVPVLSWEILLWRAAYLASLGACLWVVRAGARHLLWCILGSQGAKHAALASCACLWCGWEAVLKLRARTKDAGPTLNVLQLPAPKVN